MANKSCQWRCKQVSSFARYLHQSLDRWEFEDEPYVNRRTVLLLVAGFKGVGGSRWPPRSLAQPNDCPVLAGIDWVETLLAAPGLVFCLFNASISLLRLCGGGFDSIGPLLSISCSST